MDNVSLNHALRAALCREAKDLVLKYSMLASSYSQVLLFSSHLESCSATSNWKSVVTSREMPVRSLVEKRPSACSSRVHGASKKEAGSPGIHIMGFASHILEFRWSMDPKTLTSGWTLSHWQTYIIRKRETEA